MEIPMLRRLLASCAALVLLQAVAAGPLASEIVAVKAKLLIDGTGGPPKKDPVVIVQDGKILAIGILVPTGSRLIDLGDRTLLPGFIDCHVHLTGRVVGEGANWDDASVRDLPQEDAIRGVRNAKRTLEAGFTSVRNVGASDFSDIALRDMIREGVVPGPRIVAAGHAIGITGGHCDVNGYVPGVREENPEHGVADGVDEIVRAVRYQIKHGADVIKTCATGGVLSEGDAAGVQQYTDVELKALVDTAHLEGRKVAAHAHGAEGIKAALRAGVDSIEHGSLIDDEGIAMMKKQGTFLVPTLMAHEAVQGYAKSGVLTGGRADKAAEIGALVDDHIRRAIAAGVKIALGTDAGVFPHGRNGHEFELLVGLGMKPMDAILAGTKNASELLGLDNLVGTVEEGKVADLVAVDGNPLDDVATLTHPAFVMHEGTVIVEPPVKEKKGLAKLFGGK
jgi:imidazolonepropionase-like amidohydrolase